jgi:hypothetical protein
MSKVSSSSSDLTINADASTSDIKFTIDDVEKASISSAGAFTSTTIDATKLTGNLPAISGASLTGVGVPGATGNASGLPTLQLDRTTTGATQFVSQNSNSNGAMFQFNNDSSIQINTRSSGTDTERLKIDSSGNLSTPNRFTMSGTGSDPGLFMGGWQIFDNASESYGPANSLAFYKGGSRFAVSPSGGITFNGDTAAANTLDDYETGTWNPNIGGNATYTTQVGRYIKIGNQVWVNFSMTINVKGTGNSAGSIYGLPFPSGYAGQNTVAMHWHGLATAIAYGTYYVGSGASTLSLSYHTGSATQLSNNPNIWANGATMVGHHVYSI